MWTPSNWTVRSRPQRWHSSQRVRTYRPRAFMDNLPARWVTGVAAMYEAEGHRVEIGWNDADHTEGWIRVHGVTRQALCQHLNDPLGAPGQQRTRHPQTSRYRRKVKPLDSYTLALMEEEARHLRPDDG